MSYDPDYKLTDVDEERIKPLVDDICSPNSTLKFTYFLSMNYPYRITDYSKVMFHNKRLLNVLISNLNQPIKAFATIEKHRCPYNISKAKLIMIDGKVRQTEYDTNLYTDRYFDDDGKWISKYGSLHRHLLIDARNTTQDKIRELIKTYCSEEYTLKRGGFDIRKVTDRVKILSYMTKDISRPNHKNLNIERHHVIDSGNSCIGKTHPSLHGNYEINRQNRVLERSYKSLSTTY